METVLRIISCSWKEKKRNYGYHGNFFVREARWHNLSLDLLKDLSLAESFTAKSAMNS